MEKLNHELVNIAWEVVHLKGGEKLIEFGKHTDWQGDLSLYWYEGKFHATLVIFSDPVTTGLGDYYQPPETVWREEVEEFESVKIRDIAKFVEDNHFKLGVDNE